MRARKWGGARMVLYLSRGTLLTKVAVLAAVQADGNTTGASAAQRAANPPG